jgi:hypothetical protein
MEGMEKALHALYTLVQDVSYISSFGRFTREKDSPHESDRLLGGSRVSLDMLGRARSSATYCDF